MSWLRNSSLTLTLLLLFMGSWAAHSVAGWKARNHEQRAHHEPPVSYGEYLESGSFLETTFENWESEFLQMAVFVFLSARLVQKGSAESRKPGAERGPARAEIILSDSPYPVRRGGFLARVYAHSLSLTFALLFLGTWFLHAVTGASAYNDEQRQHGDPAVSVLGYAARPQFWFESFQNWQSEFLAMACLVTLSIFLREKDSPESKPVAAPHGQTGT